jgi:hypothetical protein
MTTASPASTGDLGVTIEPAELDVLGGGHDG